MPVVEYRTWAPTYGRIAKELGFPFERELAAAARLRELLPADALRDAPERLRVRLADRPAVVVGLAPDTGSPPLWRLPPALGPPTVIAADGATAHCLDGGIVPDVVVTDLDGPVATEIAANAQGALVVIHAHGDNIPALERWVPEFPGELVGSWAGPPSDELVDFGGFTDGDRAAYLAAECGATELWLYGFDFGRVEEADPAAAARKRAKLAFADLAMRQLAGGSVPLHLWRPDGTQVPIGPGPGPPIGPDGAAQSTQ